MSSTFVPLIAVFLGIAMSESAFAKISISGISGASAVDLSTAIPSVYGGRAGSNCSAQASSLGDTCNSCAISGLDANCNFRRIYDDLQLSITFSSDKLAGYPMITGTDRNKVGSSTSVLVQKGQSTTVTITWKDLCINDKANGDENGTTIATCEVANSFAAKGLFVGISKDDDASLAETDDDAGTINVFMQASETALTELTSLNQADRAGVTSMELYPGDEKLFFINKNTITPTFSKVKFKSVRVFFGQVSVDNTSTNDAYQDLPLSLETGEFTDDAFVDGLENGQFYVVRWGTVDQAENVWNLVTRSMVTGECGLTVEGNTTCSNFIGQPSEVVGLLASDLNCFIATAAFGAGMKPQLNDLRRFRNIYLLRTDGGRWIVKQYYAYGPYAARAISQSEPLRRWSRLALWPAWLFANWSLQWGLGSALAAFFSLFLVILACGVALARRVRRWVRPSVL